MTQYYETELGGDGVMVAQPLFPVEGQGSIPMSPLQLEIVEIPMWTAIKLNELWHSRLPKYRVGCRPKQHSWVSFAAEYKNIYFAIAIWSHPNNRFLDDGYTLELRRMAISPDAPKNTASRMIKIMLIEIKKLGPKLARVISYQDKDVHKGTIYKASGWLMAVENKAMDYTFCGTRKRPKPQNKANKIRWEKQIRSEPKQEPKTKRIEKENQQLKLFV